MDVAPKYPDHIGFVPRPDGGGSRPHRGDFSYDFTRINEFDRTSTVVHLPSLPIPADAIDPGTVSMWAGAYTRPLFSST